MAAYVVADVDMTDPAGFEEYRRLVPGTIEQYGGSYIVRGGAVHPLERDWSPKRLVIVKFDSMECAQAWYESEEYAGPLAIRQRTSKGRLLIVDGV